MKSIYTVPIGIAFLVVGLFMGYLAKEVYDNQRPKDKAKGVWFDEISAYEEDDFLHSFTGLQEGLTETEKLLGQKLIACIGEKKHAFEKIETLEQEVVQAENTANKSFINRFLGKSASENKRPLLAGKMAPMYGSNSVDPLPIKIIEQRYRQIFPNAIFQHAKENEFGYYSQVVTDVDAFLDQRVVKNPSLSIIDRQRKKNSKFFTTLKTASFEGEIDVFTEGTQEQHINGKMIFQSPSQYGNDWIMIADDQGNTLETRTFAPSDESIWRYNSQNPSVALLSEQCYWNDQYLYEYKDFFYLAQQGLLVANIYCKKQNASSWERVGTLKFEQVGD
ncbi:MAG: hypothetical protein R3A45_04795 [Bdellovibrionota bacterium]